jgi:cytochrome b561
MNEPIPTSLETASLSPHSLPSRLLHLGVAVGVILQLLLSLGMERPRPGAVLSTLEGLAFTLHEVVGLLTLGLIVVWLLWLLLRRNEPSLSDLYPWIGDAGRVALSLAVRTLLRHAKRGELAADEEIRPLVKTVHGLGIVCIALMAVSGALVWLGMDANGNMTTWAHVLLAIHQLTANLVWLFIAGHAGMAVLHQLRGEETITRMLH